MKTWVVVVAIATSGCSFAGSSSSAGTGDGGPGDGDGDGDGDAGPLPSDAECGKPGALRDSFAGLEQWLTFGAAVATIGNDELVLTADGSPASGVQSAFAIDVRERSVSVELVSPPSKANSSHGFFLVGGDGDLVGFVFTSTGFATLDRLGGAGVEGPAISHAAAHRFFRVSESAGVTRWETSPDRTSWNEIDSVASPAMMRSAFVEFDVLEVTGGGNGSVMVVDDLNDDLPVSAWCSASDLTDGFDDAGVLDWVIETVGLRCDTPYQTGSQAKFNQGAGVGATRCSRTAARGVSLVGGGAFIEIPGVGNRPATWYPYLEARDLSGALVRLQVTPGGSYCIIAEDATGAATSLARCDQAYNTSEDLWRISGDLAGNVTVDVSTDGSSWRELVSGPAPFDLSAVLLSMGTYSEMLSGTVNLGINGLNVP